MSFIVYIVLLSVAVTLIWSTNSLTSKPIKALMILLLTHGYLTAWATYKQVSGYPTTEPTPQRFEIIWARVVESSSEDFIELWINYDAPVMDKLAARFSLAHGWNNISRVYRMPYSEENHEMIMKIQRKIERGERAGIVNMEGDSTSEVDLREGSKQFTIEFESKKITK